MNKWMNEAARFLIARAPLLSDHHADEIARDLYVAWPDDTPRVALAKFLRDVPIDWRQPRVDEKLAA